jgi:SAM-dependent methyltransferase
MPKADAGLSSQTKMDSGSLACLRETTPHRRDVAVTASSVPVGHCRRGRRDWDDLIGGKALGGSGMHHGQGPAPRLRDDCRRFEEDRVPQMKQPERQLYGSSFGAAAVAYAEHRPDYAPAAVGWALQSAPGLRVLDLGAGTGKLTATLISLGAEVIAVEPDPQMLVELRRRLPALRSLPGYAETIPLPDASVDVVVSGNAMHWFDMDVAGSDIARVLVPDGILAGLWNVFDDRVAWVAGLERVGGSAAIGRRDALSRWRAETAEAHLPESGFVARFGLPEQAEFPHGQRRTADSLVATFATKAGILVMRDAKRKATLGQIGAYLASRPETANGEFNVPILTGVLRVRRL